MATYTENYNLKKPTYAESANVMVINENMDKVDEIMHSTQVSLADAYDLNNTYNTGDKVMYEKLMYKCLEDGVTGAWDSEKWERTTAVEGSGADLDIYGEASGTAEASFSDGAEASLVECEIGIVPTQDLHGYSKPWAGGAGKNKLQVTGTTQTINGVTFTVNNDGTIKVNGTATADARFVIGEYILKAGSSVRLNGSPVDGSTSTIALGYQGYGIVSTANSDRVCDRTSQSTDWDNDVYIGVASGYTANNLTFKPMMRLESVQDPTFAPYSNICPISGHTDVTVTVASTSGGSGEDTTVALGRTVYCGTLDLITGELVITHILKNITSTDISDNGSSGGLIELYVNGTTNKKNGQTNMYCNNLEVYASSRAYAIRGRAGSASVTFCLPLSDVPDFASAKTWVDNNPIQLVYELATPQTFNLTPTQVLTLLGQNYVSHDGGGTISLVYIKKDSTIIPNPAGAEIPLTGIEINGEKFKIESSVTKNVLYTNTGSSNPETITLDDDYTNYDILSFRFFRNADSIPDNSVYITIDTQILEINQTISFMGWAGSNEYVLYKLTDSHTLTRIMNGSNFLIKKIAGTKF